MTTRVEVCCGVGGVGKTTVAAAIALGHALRGERAVVLTIDPARRLADALGVPLDNEPRRVPLEAPGSLHAAMLDRQATWDGLIREHAASEERASALLNNRYYRAVSTRLSGSHEYMAVEKLHQLVTSNAWDVVVLDTPPARHVADFFDAPDRVRRLFDRAVMQRLVRPQSGGFFGGARNRVLGVFDRLAGDQVMSDIAEFFQLISDLSAGLQERHGRIAELMRSTETTYWLVADAEAPDRSDVAAFVHLLQERGMQVGGLMLNRCESHAPDLEEHALPVLHEDAPIQDAWDQALRALVRRQARRVEQHAAAASTLAALAPAAQLVRLPLVEGDLRSLEALGRLALAVGDPENPTGL